METGLTLILTVVQGDHALGVEDELPSPRILIYLFQKAVMRILCLDEPAATRFI